MGARIQRILGIEKANSLAILAALQTLFGPELFAAVPATAVKRELNSWVQKEHRKKWSCTPALRQSKLFIRWPDKKTITELIGLSRNSVRRIVALRTGHNLLRRHAKLMGIVKGNDICRKCGEEQETTEHILCECPALASLRHTFFGTGFPTTEEIMSSNNKALLFFINKTGLLD